VYFFKWIIGAGFKRCMENEGPKTIFGVIFNSIKNYNYIFFSDMGEGWYGFELGNFGVWIMRTIEG